MSFAATPVPSASLTTPSSLLDREMATALQQAQAAQQAQSIKEIKPVPPKLPTLSDLRLLHVSNATRNLGEDITDTLSLRLSYAKEEIKTISVEQIAKLQTAAEKANSSQFWSALKKIATCLLAAVSTIIGVSLVATGGMGFVGGAMIASGVLSLANFAFSECNFWKWVAEKLSQDRKEQEQIQMILPMILGIVTAGVGLIGSAMGATSGTLNLSEKVGTIAHTAVSLFETFTSVGKGIADADLLWTRADLTTIQGDLNLERILYEYVMEGIKSSMQEFKSIQAKINQAIRSITYSNTQLARQA